MNEQFKRSKKINNTDNGMVMVNGPTQLFGTCKESRLAVVVVKMGSLK